MRESQRWLGHGELGLSVQGWIGRYGGGAPIGLIAGDGTAGIAGKVGAVGGEGEEDTRESATWAPTKSWSDLRWTKRGTSGE